MLSRKLNYEYPFNLNELMQYLPDRHAAHSHNCFFCNYQEDNNVFFETANYYLSADRSPIVEGHLMILSKGHYGCAGELSNALQEELIALKALAEQLVIEVYGKASCYEHGRAGHCVQYAGTNNPCHHFHLHVLPINVAIQEPLKKLYKEITLEHYTDLENAYERYGNYLYFETSSNEKYFYCVNEKAVESHLLRTLICNELNTAEKSQWEDFQDPALQRIAYEKYKILLGDFA